MAIDSSLPIGGAPATYRRPPGAPNAAPAAGNGAFGAILQQATGGATAAAAGVTPGVQLSRHAQNRVDRRELNLDPATMTRLNNAIDRAAQKGSRNSVVMLDGLAVVVDVRDRTVVTAMNTNGSAGQPGKEKVFTNIDSVVVA